MLSGFQCSFCFANRLSGRVKKRAMTSFEKDKLMSNLSAQLDYSVSTRSCLGDVC